MAWARISGTSSRSHCSRVELDFPGAASVRSFRHVASSGESSPKHRLLHLRRRAHLVGHYDFTDGAADIRHYHAGRLFLAETSQRDGYPDFHGPWAAHRDELDMD